MHKKLFLYKRLLETVPNPLMVHWTDVYWTVALIAHKPRKLPFFTHYFF